MTRSWKQLLAEADSVTKGNGASAWRTAQIIRDLWKSKEFLVEACNGVLDDMVSKLAKYAGRFALGVNDMIQMLEHFPDKKDWESGRLDILRDKTCQAIASSGKQRKGDGSRRSRNVISRAEYDALKRKYEALQIKVKQQDAEIQRLHRQLKGVLAKS